MNQIIIDGYNVLRQLNLVRGNDLAAAEAFLQKLETAAAKLGWEVTAIFDGTERFFPRNSGPLVVQYSGPQQTADSRIERMVYEAAQRSSIVVVTRDRAISDLILGLGALAWSPERLVQEMETEPLR